MDLLLDEQTGCLLKFSGELVNVSREDFHELFSGHGKIKWVDFTRGAKEGTLLFDGNAKEAVDKAKEANGGELKIKNDTVTWQVLEGDQEKEELKRIIEAQQESYNRFRGRGMLYLKWYFSFEQLSSFNKGCDRELHHNISCSMHIVTM